MHSSFSIVFVVSGPRYPTAFVADGDEEPSPPLASSSPPLFISSAPIRPPTTRTATTIEPMTTALLDLPPPEDPAAGGVGVRLYGGGVDGFCGA